MYKRLGSKTVKMRIVYRKKFISTVGTNTLIWGSKQYLKIAKKIKAKLHFLFLWKTNTFSICYQTTPLISEKQYSTGCVSITIE